MYVCMCICVSLCLSVCIDIEESVLDLHIGLTADICKTFSKVCNLLRGLQPPHKYANHFCIDCHQCTFFFTT